MVAHAFTIVMEAENVFLTTEDRFGRVLRALGTQVKEFRRGESWPADLDCAHLSKLAQRKVEVVLTVNEALGFEAVEATVKEILSDCTEDMDLRCIPSSDDRYFELKNLGAREADGDIIVFLDSDVIPQEKWLVRLLGSFADPEKKVVAGSTFVDHDSLYQKSYALIKYNPPHKRQDVAVVTSFFMNNLAIRREVFEQYPFPATGTTCKVPSFEYPRILRDKGVKCCMNYGAEVRHPCPLPRNVLMRGFYHGRDELIDRVRQRKRTEGGGPVREGRGATFFGRKELHLGFGRMKGVIENRTAVGLPLWQLPLAYSLIFMYYTAVAAGYAYALVADKDSRKGFDYLRMARR